MVEIFLSDIQYPVKENVVKHASTVRNNLILNYGSIKPQLNIVYDNWLLTLSISDDIIKKLWGKIV